MDKTVIVVPPVLEAPWLLRINPQAAGVAFIGGYEYEERDGSSHCCKEE